MYKYLIFALIILPVCASAKIIKEKKGAFMIGAEISIGTRDIEESKSGAEQELEGTMYTTGAVAILGFSPVEWFEIYAIGGTGNIFFGIEDFPYGVYLTNFYGSYEAKYGGRVRFNVLSPSNSSTIGLFVELSYTRLTSRDRVEEGGWGFVKEVVDWQEIEFMFGLKRPFPKWLLNGGIRGSELLGTHTVDEYEWDMKAAFKIGVFSEAEFYLDSAQKTAVFFRISVIDSNSISFGFRKWL